jgi:hypothetical protein
MGVLLDVQCGNDWDMKGLVSNNLLGLPDEEVKSTVKAILSKANG